jgi:hypothetical protein
MTNPPNLAVTVTAPIPPAIAVAALDAPHVNVQAANPGAGGGAITIVGETPAGTINGSNTIFTLAYPYRSGTIALYLNGLRGIRGNDYTEHGNTQIMITPAPESSDNIIVDYQIL